MPHGATEPRLSASFDHESDPRFYSYYEKESLSEATLVRFRTIKTKLLALAARKGIAVEGLEVLDIGCGAGTQSRLWAEAGHRVHGLDVNAPLIELARDRAGRRSWRSSSGWGAQRLFPIRTAAWTCA